MTEAFPLIVVGSAVAGYLFVLALVASRKERTGFEPAVVAFIVLSLAAAWQLWQADGSAIELISGLLVAVAAVFGLFFNAAIARHAENRRRDETVRELRRALRAEIDDNVRELRKTAPKRDKKALAAAFASDADFQPFVVVTRRDRVFSNLLARLDVLDDTQIETVVRFYALHDKVIAVALATKEPNFARIGAGRRERVMQDLFDMEDTLQDYGVDALASLGDRTAQAEINRRDQARSGPEAQA